jgi:hypothetical protein
MNTERPVTQSNIPRNSVRRHSELKSTTLPKVPLDFRFSLVNGRNKLHTTYLNLEVLTLISRDFIILINILRP